MKGIQEVNSNTLVPVSLLPRLFFRRAGFKYDGDSVARRRENRRLWKANAPVGKVSGIYSRRGKRREL